MAWLELSIFGCRLRSALICFHKVNFDPPEAVPLSPKTVKTGHWQMRNAVKTGHREMRNAVKTGHLPMQNDMYYQLNLYKTHLSIGIQYNCFGWFK